jgi:hypothetical protein
MLTVTLGLLFVVVLNGSRSAMKIIDVVNNGTIICNSTRLVVGCCSCKCTWFKTMISWYETHLYDDVSVNLIDLL